MSLAPRWVLGLWGGVDLSLLRVHDPATGSSPLRTHANPQITLEVGAYVF